MSYVAQCRFCGQLVEIKARLLCGRDYDNEANAKRLHHYPRVLRTRTLAEFAEDFEILSARGLNSREIAEKLGYRQRRTVLRLVSRARAEGLLPPPPPRALGLTVHPTTRGVTSGPSARFGLVQVK